MDRRNTNFPSEVSVMLMDAYESSKYKDTLKYYQILTSEYFTQNLAKGLYLNHQMGLGKTLNAYHIMFRINQENKKHKYLVIAPKTLQQNFQDSSKIYEQIVKNSLDSVNINFIRFSHTVEKQISEFDENSVNDPFNMDQKAKNINHQMKNLNNYMVVIEEAHLFLRRLSHGSESMIRLYDLLLTSDCRILMLSGSLIASSPFELVPLFNLLSGSRLFPEIEEEFNNLFVDKETYKLKNKAVFQNRIYGLVSRMKTNYLSSDLVSQFPEELPTEVIKVPMDNFQYQAYAPIRAKEVELALKNRGLGKKQSGRFQSSASKSGSYRVRSRQYCNFVPPPVIEEIYRKGGRVDVNLVEAELAKLDDSSKYISSPKAREMLKIVKSNRKKKGVIYSQFIGIGGAANIVRFFQANKFTKINSDRISDVKPGELQFAVLNGTVSSENQAKIIELYNSKKNNNGEYLEFIIIGQEQCMGLDLKLVRYEIAYEVFWVYYVIEQFKYRMIRYKSHIDAKKEDQNGKLYILVSTYPKGTNTDNLDDDFKLTTDEYLYEKMMRNKESLDSFKEAIEEVSIECEVISKFNPDLKKELKPNCRTCMPTGQSLYTEAEGELGPTQAILYDLKNEDPCQLMKTKKVSAKKITVSINGVSEDYYYVESKMNIYGVTIYVKLGDAFSEVPINSPIFKEIVKHIKKVK